MSALLAFFSGGKMALIVAGLVAALGIIWRVLAGAKKSGVDQQLAAEKRARDENLKRVQASIDAGNKPTDSVSDKHNRDNR